MMGWSHGSYIPSFVVIGPLEKILEGFLPYIGMAFSSYDPDCKNKLSFPIPKEAPHKDWLLLGKRFRRRRCLKFWMTPDGCRSMGIL